MLSRNFQARVSFVSPALKFLPLQPAPRLVILKFRCARELPPHLKSLPQPRHVKSPFYPSAENEAPRCGVKTGGGTLVTDRGKGVPSFDEMMDIALVEVDFDDPTTNVRGRRALAIAKPTPRGY